MLRSHLPSQRQVAPAVILLLLTGALVPLGFADAPESPNPIDAGRSLASELRTQRPEKSATNTAVLKIRDAEGHRRAMPVTIAVESGDDQWAVTYTTAPSGSAGSTRLAVRHHTGQPPAYELVQGGGSSGDAGPATSLSPGSAFVAFAGSDFWVADLGLEFLHWPGQRLLRSEQFAGRPSRVLESRNPGTNGYARVVSYIDAEYHGLLGAEAFDAKGQLMKKFFADSFKKVGDTWMLKDIKIRDVRTDSLTELEFDLPKGP